MPPHAPVATAVLKVQRHGEDVPLPRRAHADDAGFDLTAWRMECRRPRVFAFDTGISVQLSAGFYCEVVPRSSIVTSDFLMANSIGIIDPGYRGRILVMLRYLGDDEGNVAAQALLGTRIAQLLVRRLEACAVQAVTTLDDTPRGTGGFGSTGR
jgi:dUTP pyrophosphatase